jgi:hypothetical protein
VLGFELVDRGGGRVNPGGVDERVIARDPFRIEIDLGSSYRDRGCGMLRLRVDLPGQTASAPPACADATAVLTPSETRI